MQRKTAKEAKTKRRSKLTATAKAIEDLEDREVTPKNELPKRRQQEKQTNDQAGR